MTVAQPVRVVVAGGGTAGWIAATAIVRQLGSLVDVTLVESDAIGTVGVGEATIPTARSFHELLKIDEAAFMAATGATYKLGILFEDWGALNDRYLHSFGTFGLKTWAADFHHFWLEGRSRGAVGPIGSYCAEHEAALAERFSREMSYAYHLDASRYAAFLRQIAERDGAKRLEGRIVEVVRHDENGDISALLLDNGSRVEGDLFIDCTGFRGLLIEQTLESGFEDWGEWLSTDTAIAVQTDDTAGLPPYTRAVAHEAGWQWRIPLQHRMGNGIVFSSQDMGEDHAREMLLGSIGGKTQSEPRPIRYRTGKRRQAWKANCVALGLSAGFVEPLESTSIHLIMIGVTRLIQMFPFQGSSESVRKRWNALADEELERIRDFIILHYKLTERTDSAFWRRCKSMTVPDSLRVRIESFAEAAQAWQGAGDLFRVESWVQVMLGQRLEPTGWHELGKLMGGDRLATELERAHQHIAAQVAKMPDHSTSLSGLGERTTATSSPR